MTRKNRFTIQQTVRFNDLDALEHVNNATYFTYMEEARKDLFSRLCEVSAARDFPFILAAISCNFRKALQLKDSPLAIDIWVTDIGRKSFTLKYEIYLPDNPSVIFADGESIQVYYDHVSHQSIEMPADFRKKLERYSG